MIRLFVDSINDAVRPGRMLIVEPGHPCGGLPHGGVRHDIKIADTGRHDFEDDMAAWRRRCIFVVTGKRLNNTADLTMHMDEIRPFKGIMLWDLRRLGPTRLCSAGFGSWLLWHRRYIDRHRMFAVVDFDPVKVDMFSKLYYMADWSKVCASREFVR